MSLPLASASIIFSSYNYYKTSQSISDKFKVLREESKERKILISEKVKFVCISIFQSMLVTKGVSKTFACLKRIPIISKKIQNTAIEAFFSKLLRDNNVYFTNAFLMGSYISISAIELKKAFNELDKKVSSIAKRSLLWIKAFTSLTIIVSMASWAVGFIPKNADNFFLKMISLFGLQILLKNRIEEYK